MGLSLALEAGVEYEKILSRLLLIDGAVVSRGDVAASELPVLSLHMGEGEIAHELHTVFPRGRIVGWPVVSPYRYAGERLEDLDESVIPGPYKVFNHMHDISSVTRASEDIVLNTDPAAFYAEPIAYCAV